MKRSLFVFLYVFLLSVLVGCGGAASETAVAPTDPPPTATPIPPTPTPLPPTAVPETAVNTELAAALQAIVDEQVANGFPGVLLMVEAPDMDFSWHGAGGWANEDAGVTMTPDTPFRISGVTYMMTASVLLRMAEEGMLALDNPISQYLDADITDQLNGPDGEPYGEIITIRQLIGNTSGVGGYFLVGMEDMDHNTLPDFADLIVDDPDKSWLPEEIITVSTAKVDPFFAPGESIGSSYDVEHVLLGLVIEEVTGTTLDKAYQTWLFEPLGMTETFLARPDDPRLETAAHVYYGATDVSAYDSLSWLHDDIVTTAKPLESYRILQGSTIQTMLPYLTEE